MGISKPLIAETPSPRLVAVRHTRGEHVDDRTSAREETEERRLEAEEYALVTGSPDGSVTTPGRFGHAARCAVPGLPLVCSNPRGSFVDTSRSLRSRICVDRTVLTESNANEVSVGHVRTERRSEC
ncbi:hypothetical protein EA462_02515 [Natrarchaeobius halalkaliphilus]|uniref:Uncharacterized protein n=1 Tax=Natrarchaeobius halalkaliphilus TaxID=1679091 RepID=A0A3N6MGK7_9EURY|nr:hypothetical protein EA462_02515 [Natrarchaeobius halalkaliphilus]